MITERENNNQGRRTELVKRSLICRISDLKLREGDKLPPQAELRAELGVGNVTISRALEALEADGVVEILPKKGVFLKNPAGNGYTGRNVGLICQRLPYSPESATSLQCLQMELRDNACQCVTFLRNISRMYDRDSITYFDGLERSLRQKRLDGIISTVSFDDSALELIRESGIPMVTVLNGRNPGPSVMLDYAGVLADMMEDSKKAGFRRPALIACGYPFTELFRNTFLEEGGQEKYCHLLQRGISADGAPKNLYLELEAVFRVLAAMPEGERPDDMIIPDDILANFFYTMIYRDLTAGGTWKPHLAYLANKQLPIFHPGPADADRYENDQTILAGLSVKLLLDIVKNGTSQSRIIKYKPTRNEETEKK